MCTDGVLRFVPDHCGPENPSYAPVDAGLRIGMVCCPEPRRVVEQDYHDGLRALLGNAVAEPEAAPGCRADA
jgi:hypothetical protein